MASCLVGLLLHCTQWFALTLKVRSLKKRPGILLPRIIHCIIYITREYPRILHCWDVLGCYMQHPVRHLLQFRFRLREVWSAVFAASSLRALQSAGGSVALHFNGGRESFSFFGGKSRQVLGPSNQMLLSDLPEGPLEVITAAVDLPDLVCLRAGWSLRTCNLRPECLHSARRLPRPVSSSAASSV